MADFCAIPDVAALLQIEITEIESCNQATAAATEAIRNYCEQYIERVADEAHTFDVWTRRTKLVLPEHPVLAVESVVENGVTLTVNDDYVLIEHGTLYRVGAVWYPGPRTVVVTYTHGYAEIPDDVLDVCTRAASRRYQAGLSSSEAAGVPDVTSKSLGDYAVGYGSIGGSEGRLGASGSRMLLLSEKDTLDRYRVSGPG